MPRRRSTPDYMAHATRSKDEDGTVTCACEKTFDDDDAWRAHYEDKTTAADRRKAETGEAEE